MGIPKYELNRRRNSGGTVDQTFDPESPNPQSGVAVAEAIFQEIEYSELVELRQEGKLVPGKLYRIVDYNATTTQLYTRSAGHQFDVIVLADGKNHLNENAYATHHAGDTYFQNCKIGAWRLKYCLDNDKNRFAWADENNGTGVIYYMKDEWANIAPFDFKNLLFTRDSEWFGNHQQWAKGVLGDVPEEDMHFYLFSWVNENGEVEDASIVGQTLMNDEGSYTGVYGNEIKETSAYSMGMAEHATSVAFALPHTIIVNSYAYNGVLFNGCYSNTFGNNCHSNTFGPNCHSNIFGNNCHSNTFGPNCHSNTFGTNCHSNTSVYNFQHNKFGISCYSNTFGSSCYSNTFGNECYSNTFGNESSYNSFGDGCVSNTLAIHANFNTLGEKCLNNTFAESFSANRIGNYSANNSFGRNCEANMIGIRCAGNTFGSYLNNISVFDGVIFCDVTGGSRDNKIKNAQILGGTAGASALNKLTITFDAKKNYTQVAGLDSSGVLKIWNPADLVPSS